MIYNPHDNFTNLTVTWFRSTTEDMSNYEVIPINSYYSFHSVSPVVPAHLPTGNCSFDLYRDSFSLIINPFTRDRNGYYWCQLAVNDTYAQRSHHAFLYTGEFNSTVCSLSLAYRFFRLASSSETVCAHYHNAINPSITIFSMSTSAISPLATVTTEWSSMATPSMPTLSFAMQNKNENPLLYVLGGFSVFLLIVLVGVVILSLLLTLYVHHLKKKTGRSHVINLYDNPQIVTNIRNHRCTALWGSCI